MPCSGGRAGNTSAGSKAAHWSPSGGCPTSSRLSPRSKKSPYLPAIPDTCAGRSGSLPRAGRSRQNRRERSKQGGAQVCLLLRSFNSEPLEGHNPRQTGSCSPKHMGSTWSDGVISDEATELNSRVFNEATEPNSKIFNEATTHMGGLIFCEATGR